MEDVEEEVADLLDGEHCGFAVAAGAEVIRFQQLRAEGGGGQQEVVLELVGVDQVGGKHLADHRVAAEHFGDLFIGEGREKLVDCEVDEDLARILGLGQLLVEGAEIGEAEIEKHGAGGGAYRFD